MGISESEARGAGFGSLRFFVRGRGAVPEATLVALRPRINEYPELFPLNPMFPQPGRRGGSRAPAAVRGAGVGAGSEESVLEPVVDYYPVARPREGDGVFGVVGSGGVGGGVSCQPEGDTYPFSGNFAAGQTRVFSSVRIGPGFVVTHVTAMIEVAIATVRFLLYLRVSDDGDTTQGVNTLGVDLDINNSAGWNNLTNQPIHSYPQRKFPGGGKYMKVIGVNSDSVAHFLQGGIDFNYL